MCRIYSTVPYRFITGVIVPVVGSVADPDPGSGAFLTLGSGIHDPGWVKIRIRDEQPGSYFQELKKQFFGLKYLNSLMWIRDGKNSHPEWKKVVSGIRDKHSGSATLIVTL
jgi:hypothetical protein